MRCNRVMPMGRSPASLTRRSFGVLATLAALAAAARDGAAQAPVSAGVGATSSVAGSASAAPSALAPAAASSAPASSAAPAASASAAAALVAGPQADHAAHFRIGVRLFKDGNFAGALAEFERAYEMRATAGALQNVALCMKKLFRYAEAMDALEQLLRRHGSALDARAKQRIQSELSELSVVVGELELAVVPEGAMVSIDRRAPVRASNIAPIRLSVGEHELRFTAPGYLAQERRLRLVGGERFRLELELEREGGLLVVEAENGAEISLDDEPLATGHYDGPIDPGHHVLRVAVPGRAPFERTIDIKHGQRLVVRAVAGAPVTLKLRPVETPVAAPTAARNPRGVYVMGGLSVAIPDGAPAGVSNEGLADNAVSGGGPELRLGYRLDYRLSAELMVGALYNEVSGACVVSSRTGAECPQRVDYALTVLRAGPGARLSLGSDRVRGVGAFAFGPASQWLTLMGGNGSAHGVGVFGQLEAGVEVGVDRFLGQLVLFAVYDSTDQFRGTLFGESETRAWGAKGLSTFGLTARVGWGFWPAARR